MITIRHREIDSDQNDITEENLKAAGWVRYSPHETYFEINNELGLVFDNDYHLFILCGNVECSLYFSSMQEVKQFIKAFKP